MESLILTEDFSPTEIPLSFDPITDKFDTVCTLHKVYTVISGLIILIFFNFMFETSISIASENA